MYGKGIQERVHLVRIRSRQAVVNDFAGLAIDHELLSRIKARVDVDDEFPAIVLCGTRRIPENLEL